MEAPVSVSELDVRRWRDEERLLAEHKQRPKGSVSKLKREYMLLLLHRHNIGVETDPVPASLKRRAIDALTLKDRALEESGMVLQEMRAVIEYLHLQHAVVKKAVDNHHHQSGQRAALIKHTIHLEKRLHMATNMFSAFIELPTPPAFYLETLDSVFVPPSSEVLEQDDEEEDELEEEEEEDLRILESMWTGGVKNCSSVDNRRAIEQVAELTGLRVEQVKNWVNNRKRRERSAAGQQLKRSRVATSPRKQTGYTCFRTYYMKGKSGPNVLREAALEWSRLKKEEPEKAANFEEDAKAAVPQALEDLDAGGKKRAAAKIMKEIEEKVD
ncbi:hypothetical protein SKAU_G00135700 [Synaphobranchus kaupii]|uniref:Homeobox domain-containing protein n=1 Tax=Synaphobranchus kaupii TaxID=118154 RepID=A0A9Q1FRP0_SYNKA|nr:hypothetical protein SKAU_G00135700 [Synaphobranchus kaupii]